MKTLTVTLPDDYAAWLDARVAAGDWPTLDDAVLSAVDAMKTECEETAPGEIDERLDRLVQEAIDSADRGDSVDGEEFMAQWLSESEFPELTGTQK